MANVNESESMARSLVLARQEIECQSGIIADYHRRAVKMEAADIEQRQRIAELEQQLATLRTEVHEWLCESCNTVFPGPPTQGFDCVVCLNCHGNCGPRSSIEKRNLKAERDAALAKLTCFMGVGTGDTGLFVYGSYEAIKAAQGIVLQRDALRRELAAANQRADDAWASAETLQRMLTTSTMRIGILRGRMAACNQEPQRHDLSLLEADAWLQEQEDTLAAIRQPKESGDATQV